MHPLHGMKKIPASHVRGTEGLFPYAPGSAKPVHTFWIDERPAGVEHVRKYFTQHARKPFRAVSFAPGHTTPQFRGGWFATEETALTTLRRERGSLRNTCIVRMIPETDRRNAILLGISGYEPAVGLTSIEAWGVLYEQGKSLPTPLQWLAAMQDRMLQPTEGASEQALHDAGLCSATGLVAPDWSAAQLSKHSVEYAFGLYEWTDLWGAVAVDVGETTDADAAEPLAEAPLELHLPPERLLSWALRVNDSSVETHHAVTFRGVVQDETAAGSDVLAFRPRRVSGHSAEIEPRLASGSRPRR